MLSEYEPQLSMSEELRIIEDPYLKVRVDSVDHENVHYSDLKDWTRSSGSAMTWDLSYNRYVIGPHPRSTTPSLELTKTITLPRDGYYQVEILSHWHPQHSGGFQLYDGTTPVEDYKSLKAPWDFYGYTVYRTAYYTGGAHTFKVAMTGTGNLGYFIIRPVTRWTGDNTDKTGRHDKRLDINSLMFTQNSVAEINNLELRMPMHNDYFADYEGYGPLQFRYNDSITVWMGETKRDTTVMYGGYLTRFNYNREEVELGGVDRLFDLMRTPVYKNFGIAGAAAPEGSTWPFTSFASVYELARYLAETNRYPLRSYQVPFDYSVRVNYSDISDYTNTPVVVWGKYLDQRHGNPKPCLKLSVANSTGDASATLWSNNIDPYDAATYNYLSLDYYASGASARYVLPWNITINMHRSGETSPSALDYTVQVTGDTGDRRLAQWSPVFDGRWQRITLDLKDLFGKIAPSTNYYINSIKLTGNVSEEQVQRRRCSAVWIDNLLCYKSTNHAPRYASQDVKYPFDELQQLCERTDHAAYVDYADDRADDTLVVLPHKHTTSRGVINEYTNLVEVEGVECDCMEDEFANMRNMTFNYDDNNPGLGFTYNMDSMAHWRELQTHDFNSDIKTQPDADKEVATYVEDHKTPQWGFTLKCRGNTQLLPEQYATVNLPSYRLGGDWQVKSITHEYDGGVYSCHVDFGLSSRRFRNFVMSQRRGSRNLANRTTSNTYDIGGGRLFAGASSGAFNTY